MNSIDSSADLRLRRVLNLRDCISVVVGIIIGSGIFFSPKSVAVEVPNYWGFLAVWLLGGITAMAGALTFAELGTKWPHTGGMYVFIREIYGRRLSFIFGWAQLLIIRPSAISAIAVIFAQYVGYFVQLSKNGVKLTAVMGIVGISLINYVGVRVSTIVQNILTLIKVCALIWIATVLFQAPGLPVPPLFSGEATFPEFTAFGLAFIAVFWTFDGWSEITSVAGEVQNPAKTIPRALFVSTVLTTGLYLAVNAGLLHVLSIPEIAGSERVAADAVVKAIGFSGGAVLSVIVVISTLGSLNGTILTGPRIFFAMAVDKLFFPWAKRIHPMYKTPSTAIVAQALFSIPLVITWTFDQLATTYVFVSLIFYSLCAWAVFRIPRTGTSFGYPFSPVIFLSVSGFILINTLWREPIPSFASLLVLILALPAYALWRKRLF